MRLVELGNPDNSTKPENRKMNGNSHQMNGNHSVSGGADSDSDVDDDDLLEEAEPVSATLVLRVVNEPSSPSVSRKSSFRRNQGNSRTEEHGETFLQVQVQRSSSTTSLPGASYQRHASRSRPPSATPSFYVTEPDPGGWAPVSRSYVSRDTSPDSRASPSPSLYGMEPYSNRMNPVDMLQRVEQSSRAMEMGLRELRQGVDTPNSLLDLGQETIVLSGLNKQAGDSLRHIKNLYDETKYLKSYLEKLEAKAHYDMVMRKARPYRPPWYRRLLFVCILGSVCVYSWHRVDPQGCQTRMERLGCLLLSGLEATKQFFLGKQNVRTEVVLS